MPRMTIHKAFKLLESESFPSYKVDYFVFEHKKTGAKVYFFKKKDKRSSFLIEFLTPPENSKGVQHIIEHLLLSGSEKYDFGNKDPFFELLQKKLLSNINAATYPERTRYYFEAIRQKDFFETMDLYLDAVFNPIILKKPVLFKREAWRIDKDPSGNFIYSGTVLNEMRTSAAHSLRILEQAVQKSAYGKSVYDFDSGGLPDEIIKLKYEELVRYYKRNYHPSNSRVFLFGDLDMEKTFAKLDEYFSRYKKDKSILERNLKLLPKAQSVHSKATVSYPGDKKDSYMAISFKGAPKNDFKESLALSLALSAAFSESSKMKNAINSSGLCADFAYFEDYDYFYHPLLVFYFSRVLPSDFGKLKKLFFKELGALKKEGLNKEFLKAKLESLRLAEEVLKSSTEFSAYLMRLVPKFFWLEDVKQILRKSDILQEIKSEFEKDENYFDKILDKYILSEKVFFEGRAVAKENLEWFPNFQKASRKLLLAKGKEKERLVKEYQEYQNFLNDINKESGIKPSKVNKLPEPKGVKSKRKAGRELFYSKMSSGSWVHADFFYDLGHLSDKELQALKLLSLAFGKFRTENYELSELEAKKHSLMNFSLSVLNLSSDKERNIYLSFNLQYLKEKEKEALELAKEMIYKVRIDKDKLSQSAKELFSAGKDELSGLGARRFAQLFAESFLSSSADLEEKLDGFAFLEFLKTADFEKNKIQELWQKALLSPNALAYASLKPSAKLEDFFFALDKKDIKRKNFKKKKVLPKNKTLALVSKLFSNNFNVLSFTLPKGDFKLKILNSALQYDLFPDELRFKGGAYGAFALCNVQCSLLSFGTYTDPHIKRTFGIFENAYSILQNLSDDDLQLAKLRLAFPMMNPFSEFLTAKKDFVLKEQGTSLRKEVKKLNKVLAFDGAKIRAVAKKAQSLLENAPKVKLSLTYPERVSEFKKSQIKTLDLS